MRRANARRQRTRQAAERRTVSSAAVGWGRLNGAAAGRSNLDIAGSPAVSASADESAEAEEETAKQRCGVRTRAGSGHDRRQSAELSAQPLSAGAGSTARQQDDRISILPGSPAVPASTDESAEAEEETAMQRCGVRTRAGSGHDRRQSAELSAQPLSAGAGSTARQQDNQISILPGSPAVPASTDESAEAEEETAMQRCGVRTRAGSGHDRRQSAELSAQPLSAGAGSTARQQDNQISILPGSPAVPASTDESAEAEEETAMRRCGVRTRAGSEHDRRQSAEPSAQPLLSGAGSTTRQQNNQISGSPGSPAASASIDESADAEEEDDSAAEQQTGPRSRQADEAVWE